MLVEFTKMNGAGNDFILIDNRNLKLFLNKDQVVRLCDRHKGIGADGLIILMPCASGKANWTWTFFNSDGSKADMCGNGARCFARFIQRLTGVRDQVTFETGAGIITAQFLGDLVTITMTQPKDLKMNEEVFLSSGPVTVHSINTGVPHTVLFVPNLDNIRVQDIGAQIRWHPQFAPAGTNVNFVQVMGPNSIRIRTYERGVEGETLACGTGVTASALISSITQGFHSPIQVKVKSGDTLEVGFKFENHNFKDVTLTGPAEFVFEGKFFIS